MKKLLTFLSAALVAGLIIFVWVKLHNHFHHAVASTQPSKGVYEVQSVSDYDGDTFSITWPGLPDELQPLKIRVRGVDTPERGAKAKCDRERAAADDARDFTTHQLSLTNGKIQVSHLSWDKYGGRVDADVWVGPRHESLSELLIANGKGRAYDGHERQGWC